MSDAPPIPSSVPSRARNRPGKKGIKLVPEGFGHGHGHEDGGYGHAASESHAAAPDQESFDALNTQLSAAAVFAQLQADPALHWTMSDAPPIPSFAPSRAHNRPGKKGVKLVPEGFGHGHGHEDGGYGHAASESHAAAPDQEFFDPFLAALDTPLSANALYAQLKAWDSARHDGHGDGHTSSESHAAAPDRDHRFPLLKQSSDRPPAAQLKENVAVQENSGVKDETAGMHALSMRAGLTADA
jgi:hypothetical protein